MKITSVLFKISVMIGALSLATSCGGGNALHSPKGENVEFSYAKNISIERFDSTYSLVTLRNPWDTTKVQALYALVDKDADFPEDIPSAASVVRTPIDRSVVYSSVHVSLLDELGVGQAVTGVCDVKYISDKKIRERIDKGIIEDCGNSMSPNMEKIIASRPGAVLLSPYENSNDNAKFSGTGIPVVLTADYLESAPLARAEWMKFYGLLFGVGDRADSLFNVVEKNYTGLKTKSNRAGSRPKVIFDLIYSNIWNVPTSGSATGHLIEDAGGKNPFADHNKAGSAQLAPEEVLVKAQDADIWFIRYNNADHFTLSWLGSQNPVYRKFKAFSDGNVYVSDTAVSNIFEDGAFHPDRILASMSAIIHPELTDHPEANKYYRKVQ